MPEGGWRCVYLQRSHPPVCTFLLGAFLSFKLYSVGLQAQAYNSMQHVRLELYRKQTVTT